MMNERLSSISPDTDVDSTQQVTELVAALRRAHAEELQRTSLGLAERIRQSEATRLKLEEKYDALEERHFELLGEARVDAERLSSSMSDLYARLEESTGRFEATAAHKTALLSRVDSAESERRRAESALIEVEAKLRESAAEQKSMRGELDQRQRRTADLQSALAQQSKRSEIVEKEVEALRLEATTFAQRMSERATSLAKADEALSLSRQKLAELESTTARISIDLSEVLLQKEELLRRLAESEESQAQKDQRLLDAQASLSALKTAGVKQGEINERLTEELHATRQMAAAHSAELIELKSERRALQQQIAKLATRGDIAEADGARLSDLLTEASLRHADESAVHRSHNAALQQELQRHRSALVQAERRVESSKHTISFRLGQALIQASGSWTSAFKLPLTIYRIRREAKRRGLVADKAQFADRSVANLAWVDAIEGVWARHGIAAAEAHVEQSASTPAESAGGITRLARLVTRTDPDEACRLGQLAHDLDPRPFRSKWLGFLLFDTGRILQAHELMNSLPNDLELKPSERHKRQQIAGCSDLLLNGVVVPDRASSDGFESATGRMLYVASSGLPHHTSGYTLRTQGLLSGWRAAGREVLCALRPGYPGDRDDVHFQAPVEGSAAPYEVDGVRYQPLPGPHRRRMPVRDYIEASARAVEKLAQQWRPAFIQAASNHESALPALIAARRLGIPFVYEVRGLWEYTASSKMPGWEQSERFELEKRLETMVASHADRVFTLTAALADELVSRGVERAKIALVPNAVEAATALIERRDPALCDRLGIQHDAFVVGYIGSVIGYEGLDDLVTAFAEVLQVVKSARLLVVGDGEALPMLKAQAASAGLGERVMFTGRVAPAAVMGYYSCMNAVALPRKPVKVCQLVSPIKPLEVMAAGLPLVVSDVQALAEMVSDGVTGLVHRAGDAKHLAARLLELATDPGKARQMGRAGRASVLERRTWTRVISDMSMDIDDLLAPPEPPELFPSERFASGAAVQLISVPASRNGLSAEEKVQLDANLRGALGTGDPKELLLYLGAQQKQWSGKLQAFAELKAAQVLLTSGDLYTAFNLTDRALARDNGPGSLRAALRVRYNGADIPGALTLAHRLRATGSESDLSLIEEVEGRAQLLEWAALPSQPRTVPVVGKRVLNILAFSLPYTSVGYATRSHGLAQGIRDAGWDIRPYTRPGFPIDFKPELEGSVLPSEDVIDGITYRRIFDTQRRGNNEVRYLLEAIDHYERVIRAEQPAVVHAASNYVTALPALIAARRLGVPFVYEVRGFWEVTRSSRDEAFENTPKYRYMQLFETLVSRNADHVITITAAMREELLGRGVQDQKISIAYNSVDPERFQPRPRDRALAEKLGLEEGIPVIGYVGSFVDYEGLDDLVTACAQLARKGRAFHLLLVGDGAISEALQAQVIELGLSERTTLTGRVPHEEVEAHYSLIDIAPFPRKPWQVCELVSPLKPFEAMALEKAVVVSSTRALKEIVEDGYNGLVFEKGSVEGLASCLERLLDSRTLCRSLEIAARAWICEQRSWAVAGAACNRSYVQAASMGNELMRGTFAESESQLAK